MASWGFYQNMYMEQRLGKDWGTSGATITPDGFAEQTAACAVIYATIRWGIDKIFGEPKNLRMVHPNNQ